MRYYLFVPEGGLCEFRVNLRIVVVRSFTIRDRSQWHYPKDVWLLGVQSG